MSLATSRPTMSLLPPGGNGTMTRTGLVGAQAAPCAKAVSGNANAAATTPATTGFRQLLFMMIYPLIYSIKTNSYKLIA
jgi:hypothetical protein